MHVYIRNISFEPKRVRMIQGQVALLAANSAAAYCIDSKTYVQLNNDPEIEIIRVTDEEDINSAIDNSISLEKKVELLSRSLVDLNRNISMIVKKEIQKLIDCGIFKTQGISSTEGISHFLNVRPKKDNSKKKKSFFEAVIDQNIALQK